MAVTLDNHHTPSHQEPVPLSGPEKNLTFLSPQAKLKAVRGEYIQLEDFLMPEFLLPSTDLTLKQDSTGKLIFHQGAKQKIQNFNDWLRAWNNYERVLMNHDCTLYHSLVSYRELIQNCNRKFMWPAVHVYDQSFRALLAENKSHAFGIIHHDLYTSLLDREAIRPNATRCFRCKSFYHKVMQCPFPTQQPPPQTEAPKNSHQCPRAGGCDPHNNTVTNITSTASDQLRAVSCDHRQQSTCDDLLCPASTVGHHPSQQVESRGIPPWPGASC